MNMKQPRLLTITLLFLALFATAAHATVTLTPATGGGSILDITVNGTYTNLTGPVIRESASGDISTGTIILTAPAGFEFDTAAPAVTVLMTKVKGQGTPSKQINNVNNGVSMAITSITTSTITFTVTAASEPTAIDRLTFQNVRVRPTSATAEGNMTRTGTSTFNGSASGALIGLLRVAATPDTTAPVLTLNGANPLQVTINTAIVDPGATATDDRDGDISASVVSDAINIDTSVLGNYTVNYTVSDSSGNAAVPITRIIQVVNAADTTAPVITLTGSTPVVVEAGSVYNDAGATANDNVDGNITANIITVNPVNVNALGNYTVTYNVNDTAGNAATQVTRTVSVVDTTSPTITMTGISPTVVTMGTPYVDAGATATDSFEGNLTGSIVTTNPVNSNVLGTYTVNYDVNDSSGNPAPQVNRTVIVVAAPDLTPPVITLTGADPETAEAGTAYADAGATANDDVDGNITANIITVNPVNINALGTYQVTYDVNDSSGNAATQVTRNVSVVDTTSPVITLTGSTPETVVLGDPYVDAGATATDSFEGNLTGSIITVNPVDTNTLGAYAVTYDVNDTSGNGATQVTRTVNVVAAADVTPPVITLLGADPFFIELGLGTGYTDPGASATDDIDGNITGNIIVDTSQVAASILGTYFVYYDVNDSSGNPAAQVNRTIIVQDTTAPVITLNGSDPVVVEVGSTYVDDGATALDDVDGNITPSIVADTSAVDMNTIGNYTVTYDVSDLSGNNATQVTRTVSVVDTTAPVITLNGSDPVTIEVGATYTDDGATANDNYDGNLTAFISTINNVNANIVGTYNVTYDLIDTSGNAATQVVRIVNVVDTTTPVITLLGNNPETIEVGTSYPDAGATALDNNDGNITANIIVIDSVDANTIGNYTVTYDVNDTSGNNATQVVRIVNVVDTTAPTLVGTPTDMTVEATSGAGAAVLFTDPTATDAGDNSPIVACNPVNGTTMPLGVTLVNCTATDASGNSASETFNVTVQDTTTPFIFVTGSSPVIVEAGTVYTDAGATATDNVNGNVTGSIVTVNPVNTAVPGNYTVTYNVNDSSGNAATQATRTVTVVDTTPPVLTVTGGTVNILVGAPYSDAGATATDNVDGNLTGSIVTTNDVNTSTIGTYNVTYQVTDNSGNNASATRTVNVIALPSPSSGGGGGGGGGGGRQRLPYSSTETLTGTTPNLGSIPIQPSPPVTSPPANNPPTFSGNPPATTQQFTPPATAPPTGLTPQATGLFNIGGRSVTRGQALLAALALIALAGAAYYGWKRR